MSARRHLESVSSTESLLLSFQPNFVEDGREPRGLVSDVVLKLLASHERRIRAALGEPLLEIRILDCCLDVLREASDDCIGRVRGCEKRNPADQLQLGNE